MSHAPEPGKMDPGGKDAAGAMLFGRKPHGHDASAEALALARLAGQLVQAPEGLLQYLADALRELCGADAVVVAVREVGADGEDAVRWRAVAGRLESMRGSCWPARCCPCGASILADSSVLYERPSETFPSMRASGVSLGELLGVPWHVDGQPAGALAVVMLEGHGRRFDGADLRLLQSCGAFAAAAHQLCAAREAEERRAAERALRESEARFRALADAAPALVYQFDDAGNLIYLNQRCLGGGGDGLDATYGIARPGDMDAFLMAVYDGIRSGTFRQRIRADAKDGGAHWFEAHAAPWYADDGTARGHVGISLDITGTVRAEQALVETDRRKDEFLATLAHELRNPLAPISNAVQLMRRPAGRRRADRMIEMIGRQVNQMARLVDDLMEVSRIARGKLDLRLERLPFAEIVQRAVEAAEPAIERAGHQLAVALPEAPLALDGDRVRLTQVLVNLLNNAAKYTDPGGRIWLDVRRDGNDVVVSVRDSGIGIPPEALARVFDMFAQVHRAAGRGQGGLGIGLTMVKSLVELHHGSVEARSAGPGHGSEFVVRLPLAPDGGIPVPSPACEAAAPAAPLHGRRVLVVDDNHDAADTLALLLESDGADVRVAYDGRTALALADDFLPHSVLLDLGMPGMDGYEVARRLRLDERYAETDIIALTGWAQDADRRQTRNRGFTHHLTKPVGMDALLRVLA
jgi:signal transduction histidine kinase